MKTLKYLLSFAFVLVLINCTKDDNNLDYLENVEAPTNVTALFQATQDNSGMVSITPNSEGAVSYNINNGDSAETVNVKQGESIDHIYAEGTYEVTIEAVGISGLKTTVTKSLVISFKAPENLDVSILNDLAISKRVNVMVNADFAISYDVYFGEPGNDTPVTANIGEPVFYVYQEAGTYTIRIVVMGTAIETTEYIEEFEVTAILQPLTAAPKPPFRAEQDVISIYSDAYANVYLSEVNPNWSQSTVLTEVQIDGNNTWYYTSLNYTGIVTDYGNPTNLSEMQYVHFDYWTVNATKLGLKLVNTSYSDGNPLKEDIENVGTVTQNEWVSIDIPLADYTTDMSGITQLLFDTLGETADVFIDNLYFWKEPTTYVPLLFDDFEGNGNITTWVGDAAGLNTSFANPYVNANNFSDTVLEYNDTGGQYANVQFVADSKFDLSGGKSVFVLKIYVPSSSITGNQPNQVSLKLQNSGLGGNSWQTQTEIIKPIVLDQWQEVTFDFVSDNWINLNFNGQDPDPVDRTDLDKVVIQVNSENNFNTVKAYIDDFRYGTLPPSETPPIVRDGFEGFGTITTWLGDSAGLNTAFPNPYIDANNNSPTVLQYNDTGGQYANVQFTVSPNFDLVAKSKFTLKIYVPSSSITGSQPNQISLKLQNSSLGGNSWQTQTEIIKPIVLDTWQEITFDFVNDNWINLNFNGQDPDPVDRTDLNKVVLQVNSENNNDRVIAYIDNFNYHN